MKTKNKWIEKNWTTVSLRMRQKQIRDNLGRFTSEMTGVKFDAKITPYQAGKIITYLSFE